MSDTDNTPRITMGQDTIKLTLSFHHRQMLRLVAERGGRITYTFGTMTIESKTMTTDEKRDYAAKADASFREMGEKMGLIKFVPLIGPSYAKDTFEASLTDIGRNIIEQMKLQVEPQSFLINPTTGKEIIKP